MAMDFYSVLGVGSDASEEEIRSAYRKRAMACHPDRGGRDDDFRAVQEAYETLSNPWKRRLYEQQRDHPPGAEVADFFHSFFDRWWRRRKRGPAKRIDLPLTLAEIYKGTTVKYRILRRVLPSVLRPCHDCGGRGHVYRETDLGILRAKTSHVCRACHGEGVRIQPSDYETQEEILHFSIEPGTPEHYEIVIPNKGDELPNRRPGDVVFRVVYKQDDVFRVSPPLDLVTDVHIGLQEFLTGFERQITCLDGDQLKIVLPRGELLQSFTHTMRAKGIRYRDQTGNLVIHIILDAPPKLPLAMVDRLEGIFATVEW